MSEIASVGVILVNWNGWRDCVECLDTLLATPSPPFHIYLVDNASTDGSVGHVQAWCAEPRAQDGWRTMPRVQRLTDGTSEPIALRFVDAHDAPASPPPSGCRLTIVRAGGNRGFAGGNNLGIAIAASAGHSHYWLLNTDTVVPPDALAALLRRAQSDAAVGMVGSTLVFYDEPSKVQALGGAINLRTMQPYHLGAGISTAEVPTDAAAIERQMSYVVGASMLVTREFVQAIGPMAEDYFLYYEEIDWAMRAHGRFRMGFAPASVVYHKGGATSRKVRSRFSLELLYRNRLKFVARHAASSYARVLALLALELLRLLARGNLSHARASAMALRDAAALYRSERRRSAQVQ